jgi:hypothetical protein
MSKGLRAGFTRFELLAAMLIVSAIALIIYIYTYPMFRPEVKWHAIMCVSNMRNIGLGLAMYTADYDGALIKENYGIPPKPSESLGAAPMSESTRTAVPQGPHSGAEPKPKSPNRIVSYSWRWAILPYLRNVDVFACPSNALAATRKCGYPLCLMSAIQPAITPVRNLCRRGTASIGMSSVSPMVRWRHKFRSITRYRYR